MHVGALAVENPGDIAGGDGLDRKHAAWYYAVVAPIIVCLHKTYDARRAIQGFQTPFYRCLVILPTNSRSRRDQPTRVKPALGFLVVVSASTNTPHNCSTFFRYPAALQSPQLLGYIPVTVQYAHIHGWTRAHSTCAKG